MTIFTDANRICANEKCQKSFNPCQAIQKYCSGKCRRRVLHLRYLEKNPDARKVRLDKLEEWHEKHPAAKRVKRRYFDPQIKYPGWLDTRKRESDEHGIAGTSAGLSSD